MTTHASGRPSLDQPDPSISFGGAFGRFWQKAFTFSGRASRREFWFAYLASVIPIAVVYIIAMALMSSFSQSGVTVASVLMLLVFAYGIASVIPQISVTVRRLHDANLSGGAYFVSLVPLVGAIILLIMLAQRSDPRGVRFDVPPVGSLVPAPGQYAGMPLAGSVPPPPPPSSLPTQSPVSLPAGSVPPPPPPPPSLTPAPVSLAPSPVSLPTGSVSPPPPPLQTPAIVSPPAFAPAEPLPRNQASAHESIDLDDTRVAAPVANASWIVEVGDGRLVPLRGTVYLGRDPVALDTTLGALCVPIHEQQKSMSKTHARLQLRKGQVEVTDLHSTNGTVVLTTDGGSTTLSPGVPVLVDSDVTVQLGDVSIRVSRSRG